MRIACLYLAAMCAGGCNGDASKAPAPSPYIHGPPIAKLSPDELHALSDECEKYPDTKPARGPYDAAYCADAMAAWSDSPIQMLPLRPEQKPNPPDAPSPIPPSR